MKFIRVALPAVWRILLSISILVAGSLVLGADVANGKASIGAPDQNSLDHDVSIPAGTILPVRLGFPAADTKSFSSQRPELSAGPLQKRSHSKSLFCEAQ